MRSLKLAFIAVCSLAIVGCTYTETKQVPVRSTSGLKNPGAFPGETFGSGGKVSCGTRVAVDGYVPFCGVPADGDEFDPRNRSVCAPQPVPVTYVQQQTGGFGVGMSLGSNSDVDPMISASVQAGVPTPTEY